MEWMMSLLTVAGLLAERQEVSARCRGLKQPHEEKGAMPTASKWQEENSLNVVRAETGDDSRREQGEIPGDQSHEVKGDRLSQDVISCWGNW
jgi:hypothetical protein